MKEKDQGKERRGGKVEKKVGNSGKKMGEPVSQLPIGEAAGKLQGIERKEERNADAMLGTSGLFRDATLGATIQRSRFRDALRESPFNFI